MGEKRPVGRPKMKLEDLAEAWNKRFTEESPTKRELTWQGVVLDLAKQGASDVEIRGKLEISEDLWYRLIKEEPQFSQTIKRAKDLCRIWWERSGRENLHDKDFSPTLWYMNMKNRFGWRDKQDVTTNGEAITLNITTTDGAEHNPTSTPE